MAVLTAAAAMATVITEAEKRSPIMTSLCLAVRYGDELFLEQKIRPLLARAKSVRPSRFLRADLLATTITRQAHSDEILRRLRGRALSPPRDRRGPLRDHFDPGGRDRGRKASPALADYGPAPHRNRQPPARTGQASNMQSRGYQVRQGHRARAARLRCSL